MFQLFKKPSRSRGAWAPDGLPRHVAIIMDGNGRWAKKRALPRSAGHSAGAETFRRIAVYCKDIGIQYLTVYAFSTENWKRPPDEVNTIMELLEKYLHEALAKMERDKVKMKFFGDVSALPPELQSLIRETEELSKRFDGVQVNICLNYGGRDEILRAAEKYAAERYAAGAAAKDPAGGVAEDPAGVAAEDPAGVVAEDPAGVAAEDPAGLGGNVGPGPLTEELFSKYLYSAGMPDPDLIIRPSGEMRMSNFLLWQMAYSELYFTDLLWPDFDERELDRAILAYQNRERRYGGLRPPV